MLAYVPEQRSDINMLLRDEFLQITKEDLRVIKVKEGKCKKKKKKCQYDGGGDTFNLKNYVLYKEFKEEPYNDEVRNEEVYQHNKQRKHKMKKRDEQLLTTKSDDVDEYKIVDDSYNVFLKILIKEESKMNEIQFTYNLLKDSIDNVMEEIKKEFNLSKDNLNQS